MMWFNYGSARGDFLDYSTGSPSTYTMRATMDGNQGAGDWNYIELDNSSHFVMYSCWPTLGGTAYNDYVWIYSRTSTMDDQKVADIKARIQQKLPDYNLSTFTNMHKTNQNGCTYEWGTL